MFIIVIINIIILYYSLKTAENGSHFFFKMRERTHVTLKLFSLCEFHIVDDQGA